MAAETRRKEYMQRWENYKSQKIKEKSDTLKNPKCTSSSKVTKFSGVTKLRRQTLASFESKKFMDSRSRRSLAPHFQPKTDLKGLNSDKKTKITKNMKDISSAQPKENKANMNETTKLVSTSKFRDVPSRTDSNLIRRKTLDPNFKRRLPKDNSAIKKESVTDQVILKSAIKKEVTLQKELKTLLISTNFGTPNTLKIPSIRRSKMKMLQDSSQNKENVKKIKRRSVKFLTPENSNKPYSHDKCESLDERREKMNEWLRKRGKAPVTNRHSLCFCKKVDNHDGPHDERTFTKEEIMMQKQMLDDEKHKVPECNQESPKKFEVPKPFDNNCLPEMETPAEIQEQLDHVIQECCILLNAGCPSSNILHWLEEIQERLPAAMKSAEFWLLKAQVYAINKDLDSLLEVFSNAMQHGATPIDSVARSMPEMIKDVIASSNEAKNNKICASEEMPVSEDECELADSDEMNDDDDDSIYSPSQNPIGMDSIFEYDIDMEMKTPLPPTTPEIMRITAASAIKYAVKKTTPFKKRIASHDDSAVIVTPVRRSTRKSLGRKSFGGFVIDSLDELSLSDKKNLLLKSNTALENFN